MTADAEDSPAGAGMIRTRIWNTQMYEQRLVAATGRRKYGKKTNAISVHENETFKFKPKSHAVHGCVFENAIIAKYVIYPIWFVWEFRTKYARAGEMIFELSSPKCKSCYY